MRSERPRRPRETNPLLQGVLVLDKPPGLTSQQAVSRAKGALSAARVGHGGTLDPFATGVLPLLLNSATRISALLLGDDKVYQGVAHLGVVTDTLDVTGKVLEERPVPPLVPAEIRAALEGFLGEIEQVPPMYSAVKVGGQRLYRLARKQIEIERAPKKVRIDEVEVLSVDLPSVEFRVRCSGGTYVRALVDDLGERLGCGAYLSRLRRLRSGSFRIEDAVSLDQLDALADAFAAEAPPGPAAAAEWWARELGGSLMPLPQALPRISSVGLSDAGLSLVAQGEPVRAGDVREVSAEFEAGDPLLLVRGTKALALARAASASRHFAEISPRAVVARVERLLR